ncbi:MAG: metabolite traffic protein EboE [Acidiferrobacterales bacterium]|nr:metabolite traffic protein EboE [Acidiferrobacterales bacterium]
MNTWKKKELAYCSNVHPGVTLEAINNNIEKWLGAVARARSREEMAGGLWLPQMVTEQLISNQNLQQLFSEKLAENNIWLATLNGFPYGDFHQAVVKEKVYQPTWAEKNRQIYTQQLAEIFATCSPDFDRTYSISTLPLGYAKTWNAEQHELALLNLCELAQQLLKLEHETGKHICVCLEMEPDCVLEKTDQLVHFFTKDLEQKAKSQGLSIDTIYRYIGCCFDTCHQAIMFENIYESLGKISRANIRIGKIQLSSAPRIKINSVDDIHHVCMLFNEQKFLHQVKVKDKSDNIYSFPDLSQNLISILETNEVDYLEAELRTHFHIPIHLKRFDTQGVETTQMALTDVFRFYQDKKNSLPKPQLEVETYTWNQLVEKDHKFDLLQGLTSELNWLDNQLTKYDLLMQA